MYCASRVYKSPVFPVLRRWMGGPSSHLKQLKGLVRKAHQTLQLEHPKIQLEEQEQAIRLFQAHYRARDMEHVPPCDRGSCRGTAEGVWCSVPIAYPPRHWPTVFNARGKSMRELECNDSEKRRVRKYVLPEDVMIYQPGSRKRTEDGIEKLGMTMMDNVLAIDLQWNTPERDPDVITLGFGFESIDQEKLEEGFGWKMDAFSNFIDVQKLAAMCGYPSDASLSTLMDKILDVRMHMEPNLDTVDWESERLAPAASLCASLSVFAIGQIYRRLRYLHALPRRCSTCRQELGIFYDHSMQCLDDACDEMFDGVEQHRQHCLMTSHPYKSQLCLGCHRILPSDQQTRLKQEAVATVASHQLHHDDPLARRFASSLYRRQLRDSKHRYMEHLVSCGSQLTTVLYGDGT